MSRTALLPACDEELTLNYWLRNAATWAHLVDEIHIYITGLTADTIVLPDLPDKYKITRHTVHRFGHGPIMDRMLQEVTTDTLVFCEDDAWARNPVALDQMFTLIESDQCDVVGSPRHTGSQGVLERAIEKWGWMHTASGESGTSLWPCWLFGRTSQFKEYVTTLGACGWQPGETIQGLQMTSQVVEAADTFAAATWELLAAGMRIKHVPQFRVGDKNSLQRWLPFNPAWLHVGSLSVRKTDNKGNTFADVLAATNGNIELVVSRVDLEKRLWWWRHIARVTRGAGLPQHEDYATAVIDIMAAARVSHAALDGWNTFEKWINWKDDEQCTFC